MPRPKPRQRLPPITAQCAACPRAGTVWRGEGCRVNLPRGHAPPNLFLRQKRLGRKSRQEGDPMNDRHRRTFMDRPTRRTFIQPVTLYARQAAAARGDSPRAIFLRIVWGVKSWRRILEFRRGLAYAAPSMSSAVTRNSPQIGVSRFRGAQPESRIYSRCAHSRSPARGRNAASSLSSAMRGVPLQRRSLSAPAEARHGVPCRGEFPAAASRRM